MTGLLDFLQSASNSVASNVTAPVDGIAWLLRKAGIPVPDAPVGGSDWAQNAGLTRPVQQSGASLAGESLGMIAPMLIAAKAPQVARGLLQAGENLAAPATMNPQTGAIVWHGSPHKFDKFDSSKIGTGEGAQAYGHGLYLAEKKDVSLPYMKPAYRDMVGASIDGKPVNSLNLNYEQYTGARAADRAGGIPQAIEKYTSEVNDALARGDKRYAEAMQEVLDSVKALPGQTLKRSEDAAKDLFSGHNGSLYKVDLPDEQIAKMLDWDKPLSQQPHVMKALDRLGVPAKPEITGDELIRGNLLKGLSNYDGVVMRGEDALRSKGIPGIRYLDGGSRGTGAGTSNFVVFPGNEGLLSILERNGQALPKKFTYPQDKALATAQRNAALPIEQGGLGLGPENTAMERARALGFTDEGLLHGTPNDFPAFHVTRQSVYATKEPEIADIYATAGQRHKGFNVLNAEPNVIPLVSRGKRMEISDIRDGSHGWYPDNLRDALGTDKTRGLVKELPNHGYDSIRIKDMTDLGGVQDQYVFPNPNVLRSRFAAFDPAKRNENDLLGQADPELLSLMATGLLGYGGYNALSKP